VASEAMMRAAVFVDRVGYCSGAFFRCSRPANSAVILKKFHCYSIVISLFRKATVRLQAIETAGRPGTAAPGFFQKFAVNSTVTSYCEAISM
jgi:hypothetical protein